MPKKHKVKLTPWNTPMHSFEKVKRWNVCQAIAQVLYKLSGSDEKLAELYNNYLNEYHKENKC